MDWLFRTGFMSWFWTTWLFNLVFWPVGLFLDGSSPEDPLELLAAPLISLPFALPIGLVVAGIVLPLAVLGWWLARSITAWADISGSPAAGITGIVATIFMLAPPAWFSGMMSGEEPEDLDLKALVYVIVSLAGPVAAIAGPFVAMTLTRERFPRP